MQTWLTLDPNTDFSIHNLPFGIFSTHNHSVGKVGVALGDFVIDLDILAHAGALHAINVDAAVFRRPVLNDLMAYGPAVRLALRTTLQALYTDAQHPHHAAAQAALIPMRSVQLHLPVAIGDYTDFYSSEAHATNVGRMFRDPANALLPNWKHLPVAYHGRTSSITVSGTPFRRPCGQIKPDPDAPPIYAPTRRLDFELEVAHIIGQASNMGESIPMNEAETYVFGYVLFNDWSARDIQQWEYVPLGPFLAKNFFSSISPWVVTPEALAPFRVAAPPQEPAVLPYLQGERHNYDVELEVSLLPHTGTHATVVCRSNFNYLYWTVAQQIAHHTVNGCPLRVGDMMASGTISGPMPDSVGSLLERTLGGKQPLTLDTGETRSFVQDFDQVIIRGWAQRGEVRVGFGEVRNQVLPATPIS